MPPFEPVRLRESCRHRLRRAVHRRRRALAAGLAVLAAALVLAVPTGHRTPPEAASAAGASTGPGQPGSGSAERGGASTARPPAARAPVSVPVRIADAAAAALLKPGDRVDVLAAGGTGAGTSGSGGGVRVVARNARVAEVPGRIRSDGQSGSADGMPALGPAAGALVVLTVPHRKAAALAGAAAHSPLTVVLR